MKKFWFPLISILEIVGGVSGMIFLIWWFLISPFNIHSLLFAPILAGISVFSIFAGYWLWTGNSFGRKASIIVQAVQILKIFSPIIIFMFSFGFDLWIQALILNDGKSNFGIEFRFLSYNQLFFGAEDAPTGIGLSITALIFLLILINYGLEYPVNKIETPPQPPSFELNQNE